jgi:hypothetical protein
METFVDLLTLCNFCILCNVLDPRTYNFPDISYGSTANATHLSQRRQHDYNALTPSQRLHFSYIRGLAINLIHWIHCHYVFKDDEGTHNDFITLARTCLHQLILAILHYKIRAEAEDIRGIPNCSSSDLSNRLTLHRGYDRIFGAFLFQSGGCRLPQLGM